MDSSGAGDIPQDLYERILEKAEERKKSGCDPFVADWQSILEIPLWMVRDRLRDNPGRLVALLIDGAEETDFYMDLEEKLDLPPDTHAVLSTPSFSKTIAEALSGEGLGSDKVEEVPEEETAYLVIISDCHDYEIIMHISLPSLAGPAGIDVFEDGKHIADYSYNTAEECTEALAKVPWIFFSPRGDWTREQIVQYTENWFSKAFGAPFMQSLPLHPEFSYVHHPERLDLTAMEAVFRMLQATVPFDYDSLGTAIELTNDLNRDADPPEVVVTEEGILKDDPDQCQALAARICVEMDQRLDDLQDLEGIAFSDRNAPGFRTIFDKTLRAIYETVTGRACPDSVKVW